MKNYGLLISLIICLCFVGCATPLNPNVENQWFQQHYTQNSTEQKKPFVTQYNNDRLSPILKSVNSYRYGKIGDKNHLAKQVYLVDQQIDSSTNQLFQIYVAESTEGEHIVDQEVATISVPKEAPNGSAAALEEMVSKQIGIHLEQKQDKHVNPTTFKAYYHLQSAKLQRTCISEHSQSDIGEALKTLNGNYFGQQNMSSIKQFFVVPWDGSRYQLNVVSYNGNEFITTPVNLIDIPNQSAAAESIATLMSTAYETWQANLK